MSAPYSTLITVGNTGGDFRKIQDAINAAVAKAAQQGDSGATFVVNVAPGIYRENVSMSPNVNLAGAGPNQTVLQGTLQYSPTDQSAAPVAVTGLMIQDNGLGAGNLVYASDAAISLRRCRISGTLGSNQGSLAGIYIDGPSWCWLDDVTVTLSDGGFAASSLIGVQFPFYSGYNWDPCGIVNSAITVTTTNASSQNVAALMGPGFVYNTGLTASGSAAGNAINNFTPASGWMTGVQASLIQGGVTSKVSGNVEGSYCFNAQFKPVNV